MAHEHTGANHSPQAAEPAPVWPVEVQAWPTAELDQPDQALASEAADVEALAQEQRDTFRAQIEQAAEILDNPEATAAELQFAKYIGGKITPVEEKGKVHNVVRGIEGKDGKPFVVDTQSAQKVSAYAARQEEKRRKKIAEDEANEAVQTAFEQPKAAKEVDHKPVGSPAPAPKPVQPSATHPTPKPKPQPAADPEHLSPDHQAFKNDVIKVAKMTPAELVAVDPSTLHPTLAQSKGFKDQRFQAVAALSSDMARQLRGEPGVNTYTKQEIIDFAHKVADEDMAFREDEENITFRPDGASKQAVESEILEERVSQLYEAAVASPERPEDVLLSPAVAPRATKPESTPPTSEELDRQKAKDDADLVAGMSNEQLAVLDISKLHPSVRDSLGLRDRRFRGVIDMLDEIRTSISGLGRPVTKKQVLDFVNHIENVGSAVVTDDEGNLIQESFNLTLALTNLRAIANNTPGGPDDALYLSGKAPAPTPPPVRPPIRTIPTPTSGTSGEKLSTSAYYATMHEGGVFVGDKVVADKLLDQGGTADVVLDEVLDRIGGDHINTKGFPTAGDYVWDTLNGLTFDGMNMSQAVHAKATLAKMQEMIKKHRFSGQFTQEQAEAIGIGMIRAQDAINSIKPEDASVPVELPTDEYLRAYQHFVGPLTAAEVPTGRARATMHHTPWEALASRTNTITYNGEKMTEYEARVKQDIEQVNAAAGDPKTIAWILNLPKKYITPPAREHAYLILAQHSAAEAEERAAEEAADAERERLNRLQTPLGWGKPPKGVMISSIDETVRPFYVASALIDRKKRYEASGTVDPKSTKEMEADAVSGLINMMVEGINRGNRDMTSDALFALQELTRNIPTTSRPILDKAVRSKKYGGTALDKLFKENDISSPSGRRKVINALQNPSGVSRIFGRGKKS